MALLEHKPQPAKGRRLRAHDPALEEFRAEMGSWADDKTDAQLAEFKRALDAIADAAIAQATLRRRPGVASGEL